MMIHLQALAPTEAVSLHWELPPSKSLWARTLLLDALEEKPLPAPEHLPEETPEDIRALCEALQQFAQGATCIDVGESGTAMRFLTAFLAAKATSRCLLQGQGRQHQRPIAPLVTALRALGAKVEYLAEAGYPPLSISPSPLLTRGRLTLDASASSQYLSALLLLAPLLQPGWEIDTRGQALASAPYVAMTRQLLLLRGYHWEEASSGYFVYRGAVPPATTAQPLEADWSAASYAYALLALLPIGSTCRLPRLTLPSAQGDAEALRELFLPLGIQTLSQAGEVCLRRTTLPQIRCLRQSMRACPDLVPAVVVACLGLSLPFVLTGVAHLRLKESDRLEALRGECAQLGYQLLVGDDSLSWQGAPASPHEGATAQALPCIHPHGDHRIAMALSLLCLQQGELMMHTPEVVTKSFPRFWRELSATGLFTCSPR